MSDLEARMTAILREAPGLMRVMRTARDLALPDWLVFSGAVYGPVWNHLTGRPLDHGLSDYDLGYFDPSDISYEAEDVVIRRVAAAFDSPLRELVEVRNQARVHLWFEDHFGEPYSPLAYSAQALERFAAPAFSVGVRLEPDDRLTIFAPFGLEDVFALRIRPNPTRRAKGLPKIIAKAKARWPELIATVD
ncbi:MAG TPA: nucleotidyltransferase family protein [Caulobacteraceae bacterium]